jgi:hypothetical protein
MLCHLLRYQIAQQMGEEKKKLEQVQKLNDQLETLTKEKSVSEGLRNVALANEKITANDLKRYSDIREELKDFQISVDDQLHC